MTQDVIGTRQVGAVIEVYAGWHRWWLYPVSGEVSRVSW
jgi:hypothetical protein